MTQKKGKTGSAVVVGAGVAALAVASYYFFGPQGEKHRKQLKGWSIKMKGEVIEQLEKVKNVSEPVYREIVDAVAAKYAKQAGSSKKEIDALAIDLKKTWRTIAASVKPTIKKMAKGKAGKAGSKKRSVNKK
ncbi:MAG: hypothetical protein KBD16_01530 [Candidatus Pacebacteria bacterium]|nr:hypothetical protein [Candidatus Paceibacterota bacterium]